MVEEKTLQDTSLTQESNPHQSNKYKYNDLLNRLSEKFPECIYVNNPKPLKIGIYQDIREALKEEDNISPTKLRRFLAFYCRRREYAAVHREGAERVDINGNVVGMVTKEQAKKVKESFYKKKFNGKDLKNHTRATKATDELPTNSVDKSED